MLPGTTALLSPWCDIDGFYFDNKPEPDTFLYKFQKEMEKKYSSDEIDYIHIECDSPEDYYEKLNLITEMSKNVSAWGTPGNETIVIIEPEETLETGGQKNKTTKE